MIAALTEVLAGKASKAGCQKTRCSYINPISMEMSLCLLTIPCKEECSCQDTESVEMPLATQSLPFNNTIHHQGIEDGSDVNAHNLMALL